MNNFTVDILCYFENLETIRIKFNGDKNISDEDFFKNIFSILTKEFKKSNLIREILIYFFIFYK